MKVRFLRKKLKTKRGNQEIVKSSITRSQLQAFKCKPLKRAGDTHKFCLPVKSTKQQMLLQTVTFCQ